MRFHNELRSSESSITIYAGRHIEIRTYIYWDADCLLPFSHRPVTPPTSWKLGGSLEMSIAYLFLVLVFLVLHPPSWSYSMQVGSIRILRKATYKKLGTHKKWFLTLHTQQSCMLCRGGWVLEQGEGRNKKHPRKFCMHGKWKRIMSFFDFIFKLLF